MFQELVFAYASYQMEKLRERCEYGFMLSFRCLGFRWLFVCFKGKKEGSHIANYCSLDSNSLSRVSLTLVRLDAILNFTRIKTRLYKGPNSGKFSQLATQNWFINYLSSVFFFFIQRDIMSAKLLVFC